MNASLILVGAGVAGFVLALLFGKRLPRRSLSPYLAISLVFFASRIFLTGYALVIESALQEGFFGWETFENAFSGPDTEHYLRIAEFGYQAGTEHENLIVFYPLYPFLVRLLHYIVPNYVLSGFLLSNLCTWGACLFLFTLVRKDHGRAAALRSVKYLLVFPFSFFTLYAYTEGLFLLLSAACLCALRYRRYAWAALMGALCAFTRNQGILLLVPACWALVEQELLPAKGSIGERLRALPRQGWLLPGIALGFAAYLGINKLYYGDFLAFMQFQNGAPWFQYFDFFPKNIEQHWSLGILYPGHASILYFPQIFLFFAGMWALYFGEKRQMQLSLLLYGFIYIIISYSAGWLISGGRYMLGCLPFFIALALRGRSRSWDMALTIFCVASMLFMFALAIMGYAIM